MRGQVFYTRFVYDLYIGCSPHVLECACGKVLLISFITVHIKKARIQDTSESPLGDLWCR